jgi:hypothetical protein
MTTGIAETLQSLFAAHIGHLCVYFAKYKNSSNTFVHSSISIDSDFKY